MPSALTEDGVPRLNIEDGPPWTFKRRLIELVAELSRDNFIGYSD